MIPVGRSEFAVGIQMGQFCDWVQIEEASFHEVEEFLESREHEGGVDAAPVFDAMDEQAPGLYKCANEAGFMLVPPPAKQSNEAMMLSLVFRPVVSRKDKVQAVRNAA